MRSPTTRTLASLALALTALRVLAPLPAQSQAVHDQLWSSEFAPPGVGGPVHAVLPFHDDLIVGGEFQHVRGSITGNIARWNGAVFTPMANGLPDAVHALALHRGELFAGGAFGVARWTGSTWALLPGPTLYFGSPEVFALCSHNGELWVGGVFDQAGLVATRGLARWNGTTWSPPPGGIPVHTQQHEPRILCMRSSPSGRLHVGGEFERIGGIAAANVATYDATWHPLGAGTDRTVRAFAEDATSLYVGGDFDRAGGVLSRGLSQWNGTQWQPLAGGGLTGPSGFAQVFGLLHYAGALYAAGSLNTAGGAPVDSIARWDGVQWSSPAHGIANTPGFAALARALTEWRRQLIVGGDFTRVGTSLAPGAAIVSHNLAAWNGAHWSGIGKGLGTDGDVLAMTEWNGGLVVGGRFPLVGGQFAPGLGWLRNGEFRWLGAFDGPVLDAVVHRGDLIVTGQFRLVGNVAAHQIARFDGRQWSSIGVGAGEYCACVYQDQLYVGGIGSPRRWTGTTWQAFGIPFGGAVTAMVVHQGALYIGGNFQGAGAPPNLARWDGTTMTPVGTGVNDYGVGALASYGSDLIVGGTFSRAGSAPARNLAAWDGVAFRALGGGIPGSAVHALAVLGNDLWIGGDLGQIAGAPENRYVATWNGIAYTLPGRGPTSSVLTLHADPVRRQVYAGGWFYECSGRPAWNLSRYDAPPVWQDLGFGSDGGNRPLLTGDGLLRAPSTLTIRLAGARASTLGAHVIGLSHADLPLFDGVLVPLPQATLGFVADSNGGTTLSWPMPTPVLPGTQLLWQCLLLDARAPLGIAMSNAIRQFAW
jgi:hypothetical protein